MDALKQNKGHINVLAQEGEAEAQTTLTAEVTGQAQAMRCARYKV